MSTRADSQRTAGSLLSTHLARAASGALLLFLLVIVLALVTAMPGDAAAVTWRAQALPAGPDASPGGMLSAFFLDDSNGWAGGGSGELYRTTDGGSHWQYEGGQDATGGDALITGLAFASPLVGWATVVDEGSPSDGHPYSFVVATTDGGVTWQPQGAAPKNVGLEAICAPDESHAWAVGDEGTILALKDGVWKKQTSRGREQDGLTSVCFVGDRCGWAVGPEGFTIYRTTNGGVTWSRRRLPGQSNGGLESIVFLSARRGWLLATTGLYHTTNGGRTWRRLPVSRSFTGTSFELTFRNTRSGWMLGGSGSEVLRTADGGRHWRVQLRYHVGGSKWLSALAISRHCVWAAGSTGWSKPFMVHAAE